MVLTSLRTIEDSLSSPASTVGVITNPVILIVDDHGDTCRALSKLLEHKGYETHCAQNAMEAMDYLRDNLPSLIILDEMMPDMTGLELLRHLREDHRFDQLPVIFYSAGWSPEKRLDAGRLGAPDWITKGLSAWDELLERVQRLLPPPQTQETHP